MTQCRNPKPVKPDLNLQAGPVRVLHYSSGSLMISGSSCSPLFVFFVLIVAVESTVQAVFHPSRYTTNSIQDGHKSSDPKNSDACLTNDS